MQKKKAYFIGIAGKTMGALAKAFKDMGWEVTGSDQEKVYPPISTYLEENNLPYYKGYSADNVPKEVDLIVVGRSALMIDPQNPEFLEAQKRNCPVLSHPETLQKYLVKENSIVVAGTFGKTTISAILANILTTAGLNPSYMTSGVPIGMEDGVKITDSKFSVVEGDEPPSLRATDPPKFMFYSPKYLFVTATLHDHPEVYKTPEEYVRAFEALVKLLPSDGLLVYNPQNVSSSVSQHFSGAKVTYSLDSSRTDFGVENIVKKGSKTFFSVVSQGKKYDLETTLLGKFNLENFCGAVALCDRLGLSKEAIVEGVRTFKGIKTRLEFLGELSGRLVYWDFAQHPSKVKGSLEALREQYPDCKIWCVFDPAMTGLKHPESLAWYQGAFDKADQVIIGKVGFLAEIPKAERVSGSDIVSAIAETQKNVYYEPLDERIIESLVEQTKAGEVIVFMSSGGLRFVNLIQEVVHKLNK